MGFLCIFCAHTLLCFRESIDADIKREKEKQKAVSIKYYWDIRWGVHKSELGV